MFSPFSASENFLHCDDLYFLLTDGDDTVESKPITEPETSAADIDELVQQEAAGKFICNS